MPLLHIFCILYDSFVSVSCLYEIPFCCVAEVLKFIIDFMSSLNPWVVLVIWYGEKYLWSSWLGHDWLYILHSYPLYHPPLITYNDLLMRDWKIDIQIFIFYSRCTYIHVRNSNSPLLRFLVNWYAMFCSEQKKMDFHCPVRNVVTDEVVTLVYKLHPLVYQLFMLIR